MPNILAKVDGHIVSVTVTEKSDGKFQAVVNCPICRLEKKSDNAKKAIKCKQNVVNNLLKHVKANHGK